MHNDPATHEAENTLRHSLSVEEWTQALETARSQRGQSPEHFGEEQRSANQPRHQAVRRCLLRIDRGEDASPDIYLVRTRDISDGGARLLHGGAIEPDTICCIIIESNTGRSTAAGGAIAWCNPVKGSSTPAFELGIRFYEPIDASCFAEFQDRAEDAA